MDSLSFNISVSGEGSIEFRVSSLIAQINQAINKLDPNTPENSLAVAAALTGFKKKLEAMNPADEEAINEAMTLYNGRSATVNGHKDMVDIAKIQFQLIATVLGFPAGALAGELAERVANGRNASLGELGVTAVFGVLSGPITGNIFHRVINRESIRGLRAEKQQLINEERAITSKILPQDLSHMTILKKGETYEYDGFRYRYIGATINYVDNKQPRFGFLVQNEAGGIGEMPLEAYTQMKPLSRRR